MSEENRNTTPDSDRVDLHLPPYLNISLMSWTTLAMVVGAIIVIPPLLSERIAAHWLWPRPGLIVALLLGIGFMSLVALFHLHSFVMTSHERYERARAEALEHAQRNTDRLHKLLDISHMMGSDTDLQSVFDHVTETCGQLFECHMVSLMLFDHELKELVVRSVGGRAARPEALGDRQKLGDGIAGWAAERGQALLLSRDCDPDQYPGLELKSASICAAMVVPFFVEEKLVGVLNVSTRSKRVDYDEEDFGAIQVFAANIGACIRHTQQIKQMKEAINRLEQGIEWRMT